MRYLIFCIVTTILAWLAAYFSIPGLGYPVQTWALITGMSVSAIFAGSIVLLGESIFEDIVKVVIVTVISAVLSLNSPGKGFVFACAVIAGILGTMMNHINQLSAQRASKKTS